MQKWFVLIALIVLLTACGGASEAQVTGNILLPDGATVPEGATISVKVQDTSLADAAATDMGEQVIDGAGQASPIPFAVSYDADDIQDNHTYTMSVRIEGADGSLLFINDTAIPVITRGAPTSDVDVPVIVVN